MMNHFLKLLLVLGLSFSLDSALGQSYTKADVYTYINTYAPVAVEKMKEHKIPASITLAQGVLESAAGKSDLAQKANNHFGIKCHNTWTGATFHKDDDAKNECFRSYNSPQESFEDHSSFLKKDRYASLFDLDITDYKSWAHGLKKAGYATNPQYAQLLIKLIEDYELSKYDTGSLFVQEVVPISKTTKINKPKRHIFGKVKPEITLPPQKPQQEQQVVEEFTSYKGFSPVDYPYSKRAVYKNNGRFFVVARADDSFYSIAVDVQLGVGELKLYNDVPFLKYEPFEGEYIYLQKKQKRASVPVIIFRHGDVLRDLAQLYGIQLRALCKMNNLKKNEQPEVGTKLRLQ